MHDGRNYNLFDTSELGPPDRPGVASLVISTHHGESLSKEQRRFNRLTKRIATLQHRIATDRDKLDRLLAAHGKAVRPLERTLAEQQIELAKRLATSSDRLRYSNRQKAELRSMIVGLCDISFTVVQPDAETEAFYDRWSDISYREEIETQAQDLKQSLADEVRTFFGVDVDDLDPDASPEAMARFMSHLEQKLHTADPGGANRGHRRKKTAKQREKEERVNAQETLAKKTVRGVYLALAKVLHPDMISDPEERAHREAFMKLAASAYQQDDLCSLLELERQWTASDGDRLSTLPNDTLGVYIRALKDQVSQLERTLRAQAFDPCYAEIHSIVAMTERRALTCIRQRAEALQMATDELEAHLDRVSRATSTKPIMILVHDYLDEARAEQELEELAAALLDDLEPPH